MKTTAKALLQVLFQESSTFRSFIKKFFPSHPELQRRLLEATFLETYIQGYYGEQRLAHKQFYNIGAGNQRSRFPFWTYLDLKDSGYNEAQIDLHFDLESGQPLPLPEGQAEVIFHSFVMEHISLAAARNLNKEAFRCLKPGGIYHAKVHSYDYALMLWKKQLLSPKIPFGGRESSEEVKAFISKHRGKVVVSANEKGDYLLSNTRGTDELRYTPAKALVMHNAAAALQKMEEAGELETALGSLDATHPQAFYEGLQKWVDTDQRAPHQHNADYYAPEEYIEDLKALGFREVYFTQPYQSASPALWEDRLNPIHFGFLWSVEAIK